MGEFAAQDRQISLDRLFGGDVICLPAFLITLGEHGNHERGDPMPNHHDNVPVGSRAIPSQHVSAHAEHTAVRDDAIVREAVRKAVAEIDARINKARPKHALYYWGQRTGTRAYNFDWNEIYHDSVVVITASQGKAPITTKIPERWVGAAPICVMNVAPYDGGVAFAVRIEWEEPVGLWTTITVFDRADNWLRMPEVPWDPVG
jgi:hypothetical protein